MAMQVNAHTHSEPFMATKSFHIPPPQTFYMLMKSFHIPPGPSMAMKYFHISGSPPPHTHSPDLLWFFHTPLHIITAVSYNGPPDRFWTPSHIIIAVHTYLYSKTVSIKFECIHNLIAQGMWKDCINIEGLARGMWKDFVAINGSECVRALIRIAIDDPLGGGRREQSSALTPTPNRLYIRQQQ